MIRYNINIPAEKQNLLLDFLKSIGADFKIENENYDLTKEQIDILEERLLTKKEDFISARASLKKIRLKHGL
jgi:hypothetical protein